ncbi:glycosyltransferase, family 2 [Arcobacter acticola]|uniref:Glycosyltransferase, family 2 n=1 Tax=Arcobacter acticola TaxID=1849015 RepID=A0A6M8EDR2_9BACT|nr:glycosyltransferase [Arcobacter acticola]QKE29653.1 glycosyltransferase, family 2 [Arcobacter acticola]
MNYDLISVIMAVYNGEKYLIEAMESILDQTHKNFEFIIINDGSKDDSIKIIKKYMEKDKRIILIDRENKGLPYSLNEGISISKGKYIARMDADDISHSNRLEKQLSYMKENNLDVCGSFIKIFGENKEQIIKNPITHDEIKFRLIIMSGLAHPTVIFKKEVFEKVEYQSSYKVAQDYKLWTDIIINNFRIGNIPEVLLNYREHTSQASIKKRDLQEETAKKISLDYATIIGKDEKSLALDLQSINSSSDIENIINKILIISNKYKLSDISKSNEIKNFFGNIEYKDLSYYIMYYKKTKEFKRNFKDEFELLVKSIIKTNNQSTSYNMLKKVKKWLY